MDGLTPFVRYLTVEAISGCKRGDTFSASDVYCQTKIGLIGSSWDEKSLDTLRQSVTVYNNNSPTLDFNTRYVITEQSNTGLELQIIVYDKDTITADDILAGGTITIADLEKLILNVPHQMGIIDLPLHPQGMAKLYWSTSPRDLDIKLEQAAGMQQYFDSNADAVKYVVTMIDFGRVGITGTLGLRRWFTEKNSIYGVDTGRWAGPEASRCITYSKHKDIVHHLERLPWGLSKGHFDRTNNLGFQVLNNRIWPELPESCRGIGLSQNEANHAVSRKYIETKLGYGDTNTNTNIAPDSAHLTHGCPHGPVLASITNRNLVRHSAMEFFRDRESFNTGEFKIWACKLLHIILVDLPISTLEAEDFISMQSKLLITMAISESVVDSLVFKKAVGWDDLMQTKEQWIKRYISRLRTMSGINPGQPTEQITILASNLMDAVLFAGGISVPTVIRYCLGLPYSKWGNTALPPAVHQLFKRNDFTIDCPVDSDLVKRYVQETIRYFPPVAGFSYREVHSQHKVYLNLLMAQGDPDVWDAADEFVMRPLDDYKKSQSWAEGAACAACPASKEQMVSLSPYHARDCPGKELSLDMIEAVVAEFLYLGPWESKTDPGDISVNGYGVTEIDLKLRLQN